ncbi:hypothetical protein [Cerasicoccus frondis]|uniref:hypothetical protein n=1 Tax=Cerasicoccus frondis TaxID=490090 RepID=UPI002852BD2B|nr:hypothetical protein [Cerasicoccus frondis]
MNLNPLTSIFDRVLLAAAGGLSLMNILMHVQVLVGIVGGLLTIVLLVIKIRKENRSPK